MTSRRRPARALPIILTLTFLAASRATAAPPSPLRPAAAADAPWIAPPVDQFGGAIGAMAVDPDPDRAIVWIGHGPRVAAIDVRDPGAPTVVGRTAWMGGAIAAIAVDGSVGVAVSGDASGRLVDEALNILDFGDPTRPRITGRLALGGAADAVAVANGFAYVVRETFHPSAEGGQYRNKLVAVDVRDPAHALVVADDVVPAPGDVIDVRAVGRVLAVTVSAPNPPGSFWDAHQELDLFDLSDPASPRRVAVVTDEAWCRLGDGPGADQAGALYGYGDRGGIVALDIADPVAPREVRRWPADDVGGWGCGHGTQPRLLIDADGHPYVTGNGPYARGEVTSVGAPRDALGRRPTHGFVAGAAAAALSGPFAMVAEFSGDVSIIDTRAMTVTAVADAADDVVGRLPLLGSVAALAVYDGRNELDDQGGPNDHILYAAPAVGGLTTLSLDVPLDPPIIGRWTDGLARSSLHVSGGLAALGRTGLAIGRPIPFVDEAEVIDVQDPTTLRSRAVFADGRFARLVAAGGAVRLIHGASGAGGPARPPSVSPAEGPPDATGVPIPIDMRLLDGAVVGARFVAVGTFPPSRPLGACSTQRLELWDLADASRSVRRSGIDLSPCADEPADLVVAATGALALVGATIEAPSDRSVGRSRLTIIATDDPGAPQIIAQVPLSGAVTSLAVRDHYVFAAASCPDSGRRCVAVIDIGDPATPRVVGSLDAAIGTARDAIAVWSGRVYVAAQQLGVWVFEPPLAWTRPRGSAWVALPWLGDH
ncbi:MAG: hypothetical protein ABI780_05860 [Ardenticatenales bacterium]